MKAYYNENDRKKAAWLRQLIKEGLISPGYVDERSIEEVEPNDLEGYKQCHFFAGIGGWDYALQLAGWTGPIWTGSCPCQPLSCAGQGKGHADPRHLWPSFYRLISECRPATVFGEQVASKLGREWLAGVRTDLEGMGYACGCADLCAASVGAPHIRQRLFWVADCAFRRINKRQKTERQAESTRTSENGGLADAQHTNGRTEHQEHREAHRGNGLGRGGDTGRVGHPDQSECETRHFVQIGNESRSECVTQSGDADRLGNPDNQGPQGRDGAILPECAHEQVVGPGGPLVELANTEISDGEVSICGKRSEEISELGGRSGSGFWADSSWHQCSDGKLRRIPSQPEVFPLANGLSYDLGSRRSSRNEILQGAGNAIVPQVAAHFIKAYMTT